MSASEAVELSTHPRKNDPVMRVLDDFQNKWSLHILWAVHRGATRFNDLLRILVVSPTLLRDRLRELELLGYVERRERDYRLTERGLSVARVLSHLESAHSH
ncbi:MAG: helix-turn-helix transcriptional regulator [Fimbriimonadales bacterium]|nr:helix-turn-helix transcriptional regulator [Fimbriimonadales bacterium]